MILEVLNHQEGCKADDSSSENILINVRGTVAAVLKH